MMEADSGTALRLATLLDVEGRVLRAADATEIAFVAVNDAHALVAYRQAVLWRRDKGIQAMRSIWVSGIARPSAAARR